MLKLVKRFLKNEDGFLPVLGAVLGAAGSAAAANKAAGAQEAATAASTSLQRRMFRKANENFAPYREAGERALETYQNEIGTDFTKTPGYDFRLQQGIDAIDSSAASRGNLFSGATLQAVNQFGQDYATNAYDNWLNRVGGMVSTGTAAAGNTAALSQNFANNQSNLLTQGANANAAGIVGSANAINSGINNALGIWQYQQGQNQPVIMN